VNRTLYIILAIIAALCLFTGCATQRRGNETAPLVRHLTTATAATARARRDGKEVKRILSRVDYKAGRILRLLEDEP
jgi:outer membrane murein-binding lipoprotein Lpp